jgi:hypothetical protein
VPHHLSRCSHWLQPSRSRGRSSSLSKVRIFLHVVRTVPGAHRAFFRNGYRGLKWQEREADHSPPASAEVKKMWIYTSTPPRLRDVSSLKIKLSAEMVLMVPTQAINRQTPIFTAAYCVPSHSVV